MGAYRSKPLTDKTSNTGEGNGVHYGVSEMQGWRVTMEVCIVRCRGSEGPKLIGVLLGP